MNRRIHLTTTLAQPQHKLFLTLVLLAALFLIGCGGQNYTIGELEATSVAAATAQAEEIETAEENRIKQIESLAPAGTVVTAAPPEGDHSESVRYDFGILPPNGGAHHPQWQKCDTYDEPVATHHAIHAMEHGAVWIAYNPDTVDADGVAELKSQARGESFVLLAPYPDLPSPVVMTAWGIQLEVDSADDGRIETFVETFKNGVQTPERGANCATGVQATVES